MHGSHLKQNFADAKPLGNLVQLVCTILLILQRGGDITMVFLVLVWFGFIEDLRRFSGISAISRLRSGR